MQTFTRQNKHFPEDENVLRNIHNNTYLFDASAIVNTRFFSDALKINFVLPVGCHLGILTRKCEEWRDSPRLERFDLIRMRRAPDNTQTFAGRVPVCSLRLYSHTVLVQLAVVDLAGNVQCSLLMF